MLNIVHIIQVLSSITGYSIRPSKQVLKHPKWKRLVNLLLSIQLRAVSVLSNQLLYSERSLATNTKILHVAELLPGQHWCLVKARPPKKGQTSRPTLRATHYVNSGNVAEFSTEESTGSFRCSWESYQPSPTINLIYWVPSLSHTP